jgi:DHA1 family tetracycline resistance protein-like MFS transporter
MCRAGGNVWISDFPSAPNAYIPPPMNRKPSIGIILLTVFIDLVGFGIVVPLVPVYSKHLLASGLTIGLIVASFSAAQFIFAPIWGRLSDRIGRRPVLLVSTAGAAIAYAVFALASGIQDHSLALWLLLGSRFFAGMAGANITVAQAYIADITPPADRSRRMGLIGMAFGLGFIFGPIIGSLGLTHLGEAGPGWIACALCAVNFALAFAILPESRKPESTPAAQRPHLDQFLHTLRQPKVGLLIVIFFLATFCFSCFESTLPLLVSDNFHLNLTADASSAAFVGYLFAYCGIVSAGVQGGAIGRLVKKHGEAKLIALSLLLTGVSLIPLPFIFGKVPLSWGILFQSAGLPWLALLAALAVLSVGTALTRPPLFGMLSNLTPDAEQGATLGVAQSAGSLARIIGPIYANVLFTAHPAWTYLSCAVVALIAGGVAMKKLAGVRLPVPAA